MHTRSFSNHKRAYRCFVEIAIGMSSATSEITNDDKCQAWKFYKMPVFQKQLNLHSLMSMASWAASKKQHAETKILKTAEVGNGVNRRNLGHWSGNRQILSGRMKKEMKVNWVKHPGQTSQKIHALKHTNRSKWLCEYYWGFNKICTNIS